MRKRYTPPRTWYGRLGGRLAVWFIPSRRNHFHPVALRPTGLVVSALILACIPTLYNLTTTGRMQVLGYAANVTVSDVYTLSNNERTKARLAPLTLSSSLSQAAFNKARDMFANNYWAHTSPAGVTPWVFISNEGYRYTTAGENLAKNFNSSAGVVLGWMNSPTHRANVLSSSYQEVGYAAVNGVLLGEETTLVVAMYASPYVAPAAASSQPAAPAASPQKEAHETAPAPKPAQAAQATQPAQPTQPEQPTQPVISHVAQETERNDSKEAATTAAAPKPAKEAPTAPLIAAAQAPIEAYHGLNWGQKASLFILSVLLLLFIMKHTIIWRSSKRGVRDIWLRAHPIAQGSILTAAIIVTLISGTGSIL